MHRSTREIIGYQMRAIDGAFGRCEDFLFDERYWSIRYIVVDTGNWLFDRLVIVPPSMVEDPNWTKQMLPIRLTRNELEDAPPIDKDAPVSRRYETLWFDQMNEPLHWAPAVAPTGVAMVPGMNNMGPIDRQKAKQYAEENDDTTYLRSILELHGYSIHAVDGEIGVVDDFIFDDTTWILRYLVVKTRKWLPGGKVILSIDWIKAIHWPDKKVDMFPTIAMIKNSPQFDPTQPVNREYEVRLYDYYGRPKYWQNR